MSDVIAPPDSATQRAHISSMAQYQKLHQESINNSDEFWGSKAKEMLSWFRPFDRVQHGGFEAGDVGWFLNGQLNACYQCVDRHLEDKADQVAILWEGDEPDQIRRITYRELHQEVCRLANALLALGVRRGDCVCIYMPMVPETAFAMLACARIGAPHSVVFAGFSADALRDRIIDGKCKVLLTANEGVRGGRTVPLFKTVQTALKECPDLHSVLVHKRTETEIEMEAGRDHWLHEAMQAQRPFCPCAVMDSEDTLFLLYTSGSTGRPKGVVHSTAGYMLWTMLTHKLVFDYHPGDVFACVADVGWITGHSYIVYGPLGNGATTLMFESTPLYPNAGRYWDMVQRHRINQFYTAPTAIRALTKFGDEFATGHDLSSLRVLGTVGEPINPEAWKWYHDKVGGGSVPIVDTYFQTETGGHIVTPLPGATPLKPGSATFPFLGIELALMDKDGNEIQGNDREGILVVKRPWPGAARTIFGDHQRFLNTYMTAYPGHYFTGDGAKRDKDGYYWITGRVDDVLNISGHRIGTAEIESAIMTHPAIIEVAVVGIPHEVKGQAMFVYCISKAAVETDDIKAAVKKHVGAFCKPDHVCLVKGLPKTRSGKIMRRILRKIACGEEDESKLGDTSTLADPSVVSQIMTAAQAVLAH